MGGPAITVVPVAPLPAPEVPSPEPSWWAGYRGALSTRLSPIGVEVLEDDARFIAGQALPRNAMGFDQGAWPDSRVRTGMVVGSVQSGKTASMLGVAALCLDEKVDIVVLLAGTRVGLWLQTYERLLSQLDGSTLDSAWRRSAERLILPQPDDVLNEVRAQPMQYLNKPKAREALSKGIPIVCVVPKEDAHLLHLSRLLRDVANAEFLESRAQPLTMLVLDDEADDASVLDSSQSEKVTPRFISALWSGDPDERPTRHPKLLATYVGYTATPQANYLQETHNPLAPRDFHAALRVPGSSGARCPRSLTFEESRGIRSYYCGGDLFYERFAHNARGLSVTTDFPTPAPNESNAEFFARQERTRWEMISDALRAYLVAGALRLIQTGRSFSALAAGVFDSRDTMMGALPPIHTMLFHPSARKDDHFRGAEDLVRWSLSLPGGEAEARVPEDEFGEGILELSRDGLRRRLEVEEEAWREWLRHFESSRKALSLEPLGTYEPIPIELWENVRATLLKEVFPNVKLRVLNSDPHADERPQFEPLARDDGMLVSPPDIFTIFIAGNVLSRGLTLEGLCISLFLRGASEPAADTQMQMQRWFGYRGEHLPFCRVFMFSDQLELFRRYNVNDNALKTLITRAMDQPDQAATRSMLVLQGANFVATSKVDSRRVPLNPGPRPSVKLMQRAMNPQFNGNTGILRDLLQEGDWADLRGPTNTKRGIIRKSPVSLLTLAECLERFRYEAHDPDPSNELSQRWAYIGKALSLNEPLFHPPGHNPTPYATDPQSCPYSIAAYLRLWHALRTGHMAPGFYPTDRPRTPWSFNDNAVEPLFYLAVRFGENLPSDPWFASRGVKSMTRQMNADGRLATLWGTRGYGEEYFGDEYVDYYFHGSRPVPNLHGEASWRQRGHPGMALFHLISDDRGGDDMLTVGLSLPHGGPDHIAALRA